jgi:hypothetical protein
MVAMRDGRSNLRLYVHLSESWTGFAGMGDLHSV